MSARREGTKTITLTADLGPGERDSIDLGTLRGGPRNQKGYYKKYMPFGAVVVDSYTGATEVEVAINGDNDYDPVPTNTARTFDSTAINQITVRNPSGSGTTIPASDVKLILFTREEQTQQPEFSAANVLRDLIPGVR